MHIEKFHLDNLLATLVYLLGFVDSCARLVVMLFSSMVLLLMLLLLLLLIIIVALHLKLKVCDNRQQHQVEQQCHGSDADSPAGDADADNHCLSSVLRDIMKC